MLLDEALVDIAHRFGFSAAWLIGDAHFDNLGGYPERWPGGSLWDVEGRTLYALVRSLKPAHVVEFGSWVGCSAAHLASALRDNGGGLLTCVDPYPERIVVSDDLKPYVEIVGATSDDWLARNDLSDVGLVYEDTFHEAGVIDRIWTAARDQCPSGAVVISHDARHATSQQEVEAGMTRAVGDAWRSYLIAPSDCGLGLWRKPL